MKKQKRPRKTIPKKIPPPRSMPTLVARLLYEELRRTSARKHFPEGAYFAYRTPTGHLVYADLGNTKVQPGLKAKDLRKRIARDINATHYVGLTFAATVIEGEDRYAAFRTTLGGKDWQFVITGPSADGCKVFMIVLMRRLGHMSEEEARRHMVLATSEAPDIDNDLFV